MQGLGLVVALATMLAACDPPPEAARDAGVDAALDAGAARCESDEDCDDGLFCTGAETCDREAAGAREDGCVMATACATDEVCDEDADVCHAIGCEDPDVDGDGHRSTACGGIDCDDGDPLRYPGAAEICDPADHDEDCDPTTFGYRDGDGDGYPDGACCNVDGAEGAHCGDDCNDAASTVHPDESDACDTRDNDCDGAVDEEGSILYLDCDGDSFGNSAVYRMGCPEPVTASADCPAPLPSSAWTATPGDCDDAVTSTHPGAAETCNGVDDDCVLPADPSFCLCTAGETTTCGFDASCNVVSAGCVSGAFACPPGLRTGAESEVCNGVDDNCDGGVDEGCPCRPVGSTRSCASEGRVGACAAGTERCEPGGWLGCAAASTEICGVADDDCDGRTDEGMHVWEVSIPSPCASTALQASHLCAQLIANECVRAAPDMRCGGRSGYGHVEVTSGLINVVCTDLVPSRYVAGSALRAHHPGCTGSDADYSPCRAAINRYCAARGGAGGYGWVDGTDTWAVQCLGSTQGGAFAIEWPELAAIQPSCSGFPASALYCPPAIHDWCQARGFVAGYGPVEQAPSGVTALCVRDF